MLNIFRDIKEMLSTEWKSMLYAGLVAFGLIASTAGIMGMIYFGFVLG